MRETLITQLDNLIWGQKGHVKSRIRDISGIYIILYVVRCKKGCWNSYLNWCNLTTKTQKISKSPNSLVSWWAMFHVNRIDYHHNLDLIFHHLITGQLENQKSWISINESLEYVVLNDLTHIKKTGAYMQFEKHRERHVPLSGTNAILCSTY